MKSDRKLQKVTFALPPGEWHGVVQETLWCEDMGNSRYRLHNAPFFVMGLSYDDIVLTETRDGIIHFKDVLIRGGHSTCRVLYKKNTDKAIIDAWLQRLQSLDCSYEMGMQMGSMQMLSVDVHPDADIDAVYQALADGENQGVWDFEEGHRGHRK